MICAREENLTKLCSLILFCLLFVIAGCSADDPTRNNTFIPLTSIKVTATYDTMADQTVNQYRAIGDFSGTYVRDITTEVSWIIEDNTIASVSNDTDSEGLVTAYSPGETSITAIYQDLAGSSPVVVTSSFLTAIEITPQNAQLQGGITEQYEAVGTFSDNSMQDITILAAWESSAADIAAIDNTGLVTTIKPGTTTISAAWQDLQSNTGLSVSGATLTAITIIPEEGTIARGTTMQFEAEGAYSDDTTLDITDLVKWQSSDTGVGIVNAAGLVTGVAPGEVEISVTTDVADDTLSATAALTITDAVLESISLAPGDSTIAEGESQQFTATGTFSDDTEQDITDLATWFTSDNSVGTIINSPDSRGLFVSIDTGTVSIEATFGGVSGETLLTVE
ncbi:MAG: hypothetical protein AMK70_07450 [Nitrospira bacterium SG8_35_1]|nr:MAG: hypothetical protein AMK70_07450 [Nitrospira bacterium SG8_35_1]